MPKFDIPINFTIEASTELLAEKAIKHLLDTMILKRGLETILEYDNFEFIVEDSSCSGCRDNSIK